MTKKRDPHARLRVESFGRTALTWACCCICKASAKANWPWIDWRPDYVDTCNNLLIK